MSPRCRRACGWAHLCVRVELHWTQPPLLGTYYGLFSLSTAAVSVHADPQGGVGAVEDASVGAIAGGGRGLASPSACCIAPPMTSPNSCTMASGSLASLASPACVGAGLTSSSPFVSSPFGSSPLPVTSDASRGGAPGNAGALPAKRRLTAPVDGGSGSKFQRALYVALARLASETNLLDTHDPLYCNISHNIFLTPRMAELATQVHPKF